MIEVFSVTEPEAAPGSGFWLAIAAVVFIGLLVFFIITAIKGVVQKDIIGTAVGVVAVCIAVLGAAFVATQIKGFDKAYDALEQVWASGAYSVESGAPEELDVYKYPRSGSDENCNISFWLNGKFFDTTYAFGADGITESEWAIIKKSKKFEVKYSTDKDGNNVIFSLSVAAPDPAADERTNETGDIYD